MRLSIRFKNFIVFLLLSLPLMLQAQSTTVSGTIVDNYTNVWANATVTAIFTPTPNKPGPYTWSGGAYAVSQGFSANSSGVISFTLPTNVGYIVPAGSSWTFNVCGNISLACAVVNASLNGGTFNLETAINTANAWPVSYAIASFVPKVYNVNQLGPIPLNQGAFVYNSTTQNFQGFNGSNWFNFPTNSCNSINAFPCFTPTTTQKIVQPTGTTFEVNNLNYTNYVDPNSGVDLATQISTIFSTCGNQCVVHIPCGTYTSSASTIQMNNPYEAIEGDGEGCVFITYSGSTFLNWNNSGGTAGFSFYASTGVGGFTLTCTNTTAQCITAGSVIGANFHDMSLYGPGGIVSQSPAGTSQGFVFASTLEDWFERWVMRNIHIGGFQVNIHFEAGGTGSFGYGLMDGVWNNIGYQNIALQVDSGASVYNTLGFKFQVNSGGTGGVCNCTYLSVAGELQGVGFAMTGENAGNTGVTAIHSVSGGLVSFQGDSNLFSGGLVQDQACGTYSDIQCIYISPRAALNGVLGGISSEMTTTNGLTTHPLVVYATDYFDNSNPYLVAETGYIYDSTASASTPFVAYDSRTSLCDYTRAYGGSGYAPSALTWTRCLDGGGNQTTRGNVQATAFVSTLLYSAAGTPVPACGTANKAVTLTVSDATTVTFKAVYAGGGSNVTNIFCNGTNWVVQ